MKFFDSLKAKFNRASDKIYYDYLNPGLTDEEKLQLEIRKKNPDIRRVLQLHDKGVTLDYAQYTPLDLAAMYGRSALVTALLDHGVDVNQRSQFKAANGALTPNSCTAFCIAIINRHPETAKIFAQRGAVADFTDGAGKETRHTKECRKTLVWEKFAEVAAILKARGNNQGTPKPPHLSS